jgi:hypothetical protein
MLVFFTSYCIIIYVFVYIKHLVSCFPCYLCNAYTAERDKNAGYNAHSLLQVMPLSP